VHRISEHSAIGSTPTDCAAGHHHLLALVGGHLSHLSNLSQKSAPKSAVASVRWVTVRPLVSGRNPIKYTLQIMNMRSFFRQIGLRRPECRQSSPPRTTTRRSGFGYNGPNILLRAAVPRIRRIPMVRSILI